MNNKICTENGSTELERSVMNSPAAPTTRRTRTASVRRAVIAVRRWWRAAPGARRRALGAVVEALAAADLFDMNYGALRNALHWARVLHRRNLL